MVFDTIVKREVVEYVGGKMGKKTKVKSLSAVNMLDLFFNRPL